MANRLEGTQIHVYSEISISLDPEAMQGTAELLTEIQVLGTCRHECEVG